MDSGELIQDLAKRPDLEAQKRFLAEHASLLGDDVASALKDEADRLLRADVHRSLETADLLLHLGELTGDPCHRALGLLAEANARSIGLGEYKGALELYNEAAGIYQAKARPTEQARSQIGKLIALARLGCYAEALETGEWAGRVLESHGQWRPLAGLNLNLGAIYSRMGEEAKALALFDRARELFRRLGKEGERFLPWIDQDRSIALRNLGQFEESIQASQRAQEMLIQSGQLVEAARARQNLAVTYFVLGRYNEALELLDQVLEVFLKDGRQRDAILVELFISDCLLQLRRFNNVLDKCRHIRGLFTELGTRFEVAQALLNEAVAYIGLHRNENAMDSLIEARRLFTEEGNDVWIACADLEMAALLLRQTQFEKCLATAQACAGVFRAHDLPVKEAQANLIAAHAAVALNHHGQALRLVSETLAVAESQDIPSLTYQGHHLLGTLAIAEGDNNKALTEYDQAVHGLERLRGRLMVEFRVDFVEDKQIVYDDIVSLCLDMDRPIQALEYAERAKSRALLDLLAYRLDLSIRAKEATDRPLVQELMHLREERDRWYRRWEGREESKDESRQQARQEVLALEKQITELWHKLLIRDADYARDASLWQVRAEPVQPYLAPETTLLEYYIAHGQIIAFLVTPESVQVQRLPGDLAQVQRLIQLLWLNFKAVPSNAPSQIPNLAANAQELLRRLYSLLIAPLHKELSSSHSRLIIVPHGLLHYLPFHALHDGESFLLQQHEISYLSGASLLRYLPEKQPGTARLLAFGHSFGGRLPYTVQEAHSIATLMGDHALVEEEATLARLREAAPDCQVIHLAAHGEFRPDNPLFSGLALADGWLTTLDIFNLSLKASLVTLSACRTGQNVLGGGDELQGLMRAFLYAGAASLVLSLWAVEDRSTAKIMEAFYRKLAHGWSKGAALRYGQQQFIEEETEGSGATSGRYAHPYFWAPFFLVGDAGPL